jgi:hypothetical protein
MSRLLAATLVLALVIAVLAAVVTYLQTSAATKSPTGKWLHDVIYGKPYTPKIAITLSTSSGKAVSVDPVTVNAIVLALANLAPMTIETPRLVVTLVNGTTLDVTDPAVLFTQGHIVDMVLALGNVSTETCKPSPLDYKPCGPLLLNITLLPISYRAATGSTVALENLTVNYFALLAKLTCGQWILLAHGFLPQPLSITANETVSVAVTLDPILSLLGATYYYRTFYGPVWGKGFYDLTIDIGLIANGTRCRLGYVTFDWFSDHVEIYVIKASARIIKLSDTAYYFYIAGAFDSPYNVTALYIRPHIYDGGATYSEFEYLNFTPVITAKIGNKYAVVVGILLSAR